MSYSRALQALKIPQFALRGFLQCNRLYSLCTDKLHRQPLQLCSSKYGPPTTRSATTKITTEDVNTGFFRKVLRKLGWLDHSKTKLKVAGYLLYESIADKVDYQLFFNVFRLPDTFFSWYLITELHVWMLLVRSMNEGEEGRFTRNCLVEAMWQDVTTRAKKLGAANPSSVRHQIDDLSHQFQAALVGYDEGLLSDDRTLSGALWRRFFQRNCTQPEDIETLVYYIRKQICLLDNLPRDSILLKPNIDWIDFRNSDIQT